MTTQQGYTTNAAIESILAIVKAPGESAQPAVLPALESDMNALWGTSTTWGSRLKIHSSEDVGPNLVFLSRESAELGGAANLLIPFDLNGPVAIVGRSHGGRFESVRAHDVPTLLSWTLLHDARVRMAGLSYHGVSEGAGYDRVYVQRKPDRRTKARRYALTHHVRHSRTGFSWSFMGDGPLDLARSILIDALALSTDERNFREVDEIYGPFAQHFIAALPQDERSWSIEGTEILRWLNSHPPAALCSIHGVPRGTDGVCPECGSIVPPSSSAMWSPPADF